jgi:hypothetical protein
MADVALQTPKRVLPMALLTSMGIFVVATPAGTGPYSVCLAGGDNEPRCEYASLEQCNATALGGHGYCITNPASTSRAYARYNAAGKRHH